MSTKSGSKQLQVQFVLMGKVSFVIYTVVRFLSGCDKYGGGVGSEYACVIIQKNLDKLRITEEKSRSGSVNSTAGQTFHSSVNSKFIPF